MGQLARIIFHVGALDLDRDQATTLEFNREGTVVGNRIVVLACLEILRGVGVKVVLAGEPRVLCDLTAQREPQPDARLDRLLVHLRQAAGQAQAGRAGVRVGTLAELVGAAAEHLGNGVEFDVHLEAEHRLK